jgi:hypothetical protein
MMKKMFVLAIALMMTGLAVVPQIQAQDMQKLEQLQTEVEQIEQRAKARGGSYTPQETQRLQQIQQEMMQAAGGLGGYVPPTPSTGGANSYLPPQVQQESQRQQQQHQQKLGQIQKGDAPRGTRQGWPTAAEFRPYGFTLNTPRINTPKGLTTYYEIVDHILFIHIYKNWEYGRTSLVPVPFTAQEIQALKREIEQATGLRFDGTLIYKDLGGGRKARMSLAGGDAEWITISIDYFVES